MRVPSRISLVTLGVADVARSTAFYERLGWKRSGASQEEVSFFHAGGAVLGLYGRGPLADDAKVGSDGRGFRGVALAINVERREDVDEALAAAAAAGATVTKPAQDAFWGGRSGYFADPDGHLWEVAWNPHFGLMPDGSLRLPP